VFYSIGFLRAKNRCQIDLLDIRHRCETPEQVKKRLGGHNVQFPELLWEYFRDCPVLDNGETL
jgi:hypothetical protein